MTRATLCACVPAALGAFDFGLLALAGPRMAPALGVAGDAYPWLFSASSFAYGAAVMPAAALTGRLGPQRALAVGLAGAALGVGALAVSSGLSVTLAARIVFGLGGALAATAALALLATVAEDSGRAAGFAALGGAVAAGFAAGTLVAGVDAWRLVLLTTAGVMLACAQALTRRPSPGRAPAEVMPGATLLTAAIVLAAAAIAAAGAGSWVALPLAGAAALALGWGAPRLRGGTGLAAACFAGAATTATGVGATILIGPALTAEHLPSSLLGVFGLGVVPGAWLARRLATAAGPPVAASVGVALQALALCALALAFAASAPVTVVAAAVVLFGAGHVAANAGTAAAALMGGSAMPAALLIASQYVGGGVGAVVTTAVSGAHGVAAAIAVAAVAALLGAVPLTLCGPRAT